MIRRPRPSDILACADIELSAATLFAGTHMDVPAAHGVSDRAELRAAADAGLMWIAEADGRPAGFLFGELAASGLYLRELSVAVFGQRRGLGRALLAAGIAEARARQLPAVTLTTDRTLPWNAAFYATLGFVIINDEAVPADLRDRLESQAAAGFDPAQRCAMRLALGDAQ